MAQLIRRHTPLYVLPGQHRGLLRPGNIDIIAREYVHVPIGNGQFASVHTSSWNTPFPGRPKGAEVLIPEVIFLGGRWVLVSGLAAYNHYLSTHRHFGIFDTPAHATSYAVKLHLQQQAAGKRIAKARRGG